MGLNGLTAGDITDGTKLVSVRLYQGKSSSGTTPLVQPIVHTATYTADTVKGLEEVIKQVGSTYCDQSVVDHGVILAVKTKTETIGFMLTKTKTKTITLKYSPN